MMAHKIATSIDEQKFTFMEEPLGISVSEGYGYYQGSIGDVLGPSGSFKLEAKLGYGMTSSVWLAQDMRCVVFQGRSWPLLTRISCPGTIPVAISMLL
jgi:hypothetical protein